jgi:hypothetical protein
VPFDAKSPSYAVLERQGNVGQGTLLNADEISATAIAWQQLGAANSGEDILLNVKVSFSTLLMAFPSVAQLAAPMSPIGSWLGVGG